MKKIFAFSVFLVITVQAESLKIELPAETSVYKSGPGVNLANGQCLVCHSADYAATQPPMPEKFWRGTIEKMVAKYGAPIPTNQVDELVAYFSKNYGTETNQSVLVK